jgi:hypothetical protein
MVVACIALAVTLSGVGYAATALPKNSVGSGQIKANAVGTGKVADNSLTGADINESTLAGGSITGVDAALLGGHSASDFEMAGGSDAYVVSGGAWNDRDGLMLNAVQATFTGAFGTKTQWCTTPGSGTPAAYADIHLPQGAQVMKMTVDYRDDAGTTNSNGTVVLTRDPLFSSDASGTAGTLATASLGNIGLGDAAIALDDTIGDLNPSLGAIDNSRFSYALVANPGANTGVGFCAVTINYDLP